VPTTAKKVDFSRAFGEKLREMMSEDAKFALGH
jgi:hypothetical protein